MNNTESYDFDDKEEYPERLLLKGKCDEQVFKIARDCGWTDELEAKIKKSKDASDLTKQMESLTVDDKKEEGKETEEEQI